MIKRVSLVMFLTVASIAVGSDANLENQRAQKDFDTSINFTSNYNNPDDRVGTNLLADAITYVKTSSPYARIKNWVTPEPKKVEEKSVFSKYWDADIFGYTGAGKYVVVSTAAAAAIVAAYIAYSLAQPTLEDQVVTLIDKAQKNPNLVLQELPAILAQCSDDTRIEVLEYVLSQVEITPEIVAAFNL